MRVDFGGIFGNRWLIFISRLVLGGIFLAASVTKLQQPAEFINLVIDYGILPDGLARAYGLVVPWLELFIGCSLILGIFPRISAGITIPITVSFVIASSYALSNPDITSCGCFGEVIILSHQVSLSLDAVMLALSLILLFNRSSSKFLSLGPWLEKFSQRQGGKERLFVDRLSKLTAVALVMVVAALIIIATRGLSPAEEVATEELFVTPAQSSLDPEINSALEDNKPVLLYFYFEGCSACEVVKPIINELEQEYEDRVVFLHIDYEEATQVVDEFGVNTTPTILLITGKNDKGQYIVSRWVGIVDKETLKDSFEKALR